VKNDIRKIQTVFVDLFNEMDHVIKKVNFEHKIYLYNFLLLLQIFISVICHILIISIISQTINYILQVFNKTLILLMFYLV